MPRPKIIELKPGTRFGAWEVISDSSSTASPNGRRERRIRCLCTSCGRTISDVLLTNLRSGHSRCCVDCAQIFHAAAKAKRCLEEMPDFLLEELAEAVNKESCGRCAQ